jgi:hypothetical protein
MSSYNFSWVTNEWLQGSTSRAGGAMRWVVATSDADEVGLFSFLSPALTLLIRGHGTEARKARAIDGVGKHSACRTLI